MGMFVWVCVWCGCRCVWVEYLCIEMFKYLLVCVCVCVLVCVCLNIFSFLVFISAMFPRGGGFQPTLTRTDVPS